MVTKISTKAARAHAHAQLALQTNESEAFEAKPIPREMVTAMSSTPIAAEPRSQLPLLCQSRGLGVDRGGGGSVAAPAAAHACMGSR